MSAERDPLASVYYCVVCGPIIEEASFLWPGTSIRWHKDVPHPTLPEAHDVENSFEQTARNQQPAGLP